MPKSGSLSLREPEAFIAAEVLTIEEGQMLIQAAERILAQLSQ